MPSSISSSEYARWTWRLVIACAIAALAAEAAARVGFHRVSRVQARFVSEYAGAEKIGAAPTASRDVLVVGNSLLLHGVLFDRFHDSFASSGWNVHRLVVEGTFYYDWYYGLKELFRRGARPYAVVVMLTPGQFVDQQFKGDFSAHFLVAAADLPAMSRDLHLNPTQATNMVAANVSEFWGTRAQLRKFVIQFALPDFERLATMFTAAPTSEPGWPRTADDELMRRVARLSALADANGTKLVLVIPPTLNASSQGANALERAGDQSHVEVLRVFRPTTFARDAYLDGMHLNSIGAERFTSLLIPELNRALEHLARSAARTMPADDAALPGHGTN